MIINLIPGFSFSFMLKQTVILNTSFVTDFYSCVILNDSGFKVVIALGKIHTEISESVSSILYGG